MTPWEFCVLRAVFPQVYIILVKSLRIQESGSELYIIILTE